MTDRQLENRIKKIQELEAQQKELDAKIDAIKAEIKADMTEKSVDEITTANGFVIRWKEIVSNKLDTKELKKTLPEIYKQFVRLSSSRRFTIA
ncbi:MAG: hypothetical protein MJ097_02190 [Dorea sp.]|nr:hypothetical protein [Dorea sp.]